MKIETKCEILNDLKIAAGGIEEWRPFFQYADLGVPVAILVSTGAISLNTQLEEYVNEAYAMLLKVLQLPEDSEFESLDQLFEATKG